MSLKIEIKAKDFIELHRKILEVGAEIFEYDEHGFFDDDDDEWLYRGEGYKLEYELTG